MSVLTEKEFTEPLRHQEFILAIRIVLPEMLDLGRNLTPVLRKTRWRGRRGVIVKAESYECGSHSGPLCQTGIAAELTGTGWGNTHRRDENLSSLMGSFQSKGSCRSRCHGENGVKSRPRACSWLGGFQKVPGFSNEHMHEFLLP